MNAPFPSEEKRHPTMKFGYLQFLLYILLAYEDSDHLIVI